MLVLALALVTVAAGQARPVPLFEPVGTWTYSTQDDNGNAISGTMEITGTAGAYTGTINTTGEEPLKINEVLTSSNGMVVLATLSNGAVAFVKVSKGPDGKIEAGWGPLGTLIPVTLARAK